jgi:uncharacterized membrane protein YfcA
MKKWLSVILSAVVLGLSVSYILKMWMPVEVVDWILMVVVALIAIRSVVRIAQLAKQKGEEAAEEQE